MKSLTPAEATASGNDTWTPAAVLTVLLAAFAGAIDSFDTQMIGFTGRQISGDLHFPVGELGWLFGAGQLGGVIGAVLFGSLADRFGRVRILVMAALLAALFTIISITAHSYGPLLTYRTLTGIGLGGVMPCFLGLGVEAMPLRTRLAMTPVLYASFPLGGAVGAWISAPIIAAFGWRGVFAFGGIMLVTIAALIAVTPVKRRSTLTREKAGRVRALFVDNRARVTWSLWALFLLAPAGVYLLVLWMPPLLQLLGISPAKTSLLVGFLNVGALFVALAGGWAIKRIGLISVLAPILLLGAFSFTAIAAVHADFSDLVVATIVAGAALGGSMSLLVSIAANAYPDKLRATGIGWAMAIARVGQMTAPIPIGKLVAIGVPPQTVLALCGLPVLLSLVPLVVVTREIEKERQDALRTMPSKTKDLATTKSVEGPSSHVL